MKRIKRNHSTFLAIIFWSLALGLGCGTATNSIADPFAITGSRFQDGKLQLEWTTNAYSYQVQRADSPVSTNWTTVLASVRTNVAVPLDGTSGFFRVRSTATDASTLTITMTNLTTGDNLTLIQEPRTNGDIVADMPAGTGGVDLTQLIFDSAELAKFDVAFTGNGGFTLLTNGTACGWGGYWDTTNGPDTNDLTYTGYLTNETDTVMFTAVTDPEPIEQVVSSIVGTINWWRCSAQFALPWLQCAQACTAQAISCTLSWPPRGSYCEFKTHVTMALDGNVNCGTTECLHGCK